MASLRQRAGGWDLRYRDLDGRLSCVAEELAMNALIKVADTLISLKQDEGRDTSGIDLYPLGDVAFWDTDFEALFRPELDGIHHSHIGRAMGMTDLDRSHWFLQFDGSDVPPHPMTWPAEGSASS